MMTINKQNISFIISQVLLFMFLTLVFLLGYFVGVVYGK